MRLAVVGSRKCESPHLIGLWLDKMLAKHGNQLTIISGGARGVDTLATIWADKHGVPYRVFQAQWNRYGKKAGFLRNKQIWNDCNAGIAFWDGSSSGTAHSFEIARSQHKPLLIVLTHPQ